jgi:hypothetical protein
MECYGFQVAPISRLFADMCRDLAGLGFRLADIVNVLRRPGDDLFWQFDAFFVHEDSSHFPRTTYAILKPDASMNNDGVVP